MRRSPAHRVVNCVRLRTWDEVIQLARNLPGWVFRGHRESSWGLVPTLERACTHLRSGITRAKVERHLLAKFKRGAREWFSDPPPDGDWFEWLALIQHHGGPTRLLDFTGSIYVASFFALDQPLDGDAAIWAVNGHILRGMLEDQLHLPDGERFEYKSELTGVLLFNKLFNADIEGYAAGIATPYTLQERLRIQQGTFLFSLNMRHTLEENLYGVFGLSLEAARKHLEFGFYDNPSSPQTLHTLQKSPVIKMILDRSMRRIALQELERMNITHTSLFPGRDGYTKSLWHEVLKLTDDDPPRGRENGSPLGEPRVGS